MARRACRGSATCSKTDHDTATSNGSPSFDHVQMSPWCRTGRIEFVTADGVDPASTQTVGDERFAADRLHHPAHAVRAPDREPSVGIESDCGRIHVERLDGVVKPQIMGALEALSGPDLEDPLILQFVTEMDFDPLDILCHPLLERADRLGIGGIVADHTGELAQRSPNSEARVCLLGIVDRNLLVGRGGVDRLACRRVDMVIVGIPPLHPGQATTQNRWSPRDARPCTRPRPGRGDRRRGTAGGSQLAAPRATTLEMSSGRLVLSGESRQRVIPVAEVNALGVGACSCVRLPRTR